jgi:hypothetical protein
VLCRCADEKEKLLGRWEIEEYDPVAQRERAVGGLDAACHLVVCIVTKINGSTSYKIPMDI